MALIRTSQRITAIAVGTTCRPAVTISHRILFPVSHKLSNQLRGLASMPGLRKAESYINGEWVKGRAEKTFKVFNPSNGSVIGEVYDLDAKDTKVAVDAAHTAFCEWSQKPAKERGALLMKWFQLVQENADELCAMLTEENGKPIAEAVWEVAGASFFLEWYAAEARRVYGETIALPAVNRRSIVMKQPLGVAGLIIPWNFPSAMFTRKVGPALAAGCTVVLKTPEDTPYTPMALTALADQAGIPKGVLNVVSCSRQNSPGIGSLMCEDPKVATVSFTGSTKVGKLLMTGCAKHVKRVSMELGGLAPLIIFDSADLSKAVQGTRSSKFRNAGQTCISPQNFFVQEGIYDRTMGAMTDLVKSLKMGDPMDPSTNIGPLINSRAVAEVEALVEDAVAKGAKVLVGGSRATDKGELYYQPTLLTEVTDEMNIVHQEVFGPVMSVMKFMTEDEVIRRANHTGRGICSYFYSSDMAQCHRMMERLQSGIVGCNEAVVSYCETPFGGYKQSGIGRESGKYGMDEYLQIKVGIFNVG